MPGKQSLHFPESGATPYREPAQHYGNSLPCPLFSSFPRESAPEVSLWPAICISDLENSERIDELLQIEEGVRDSRGSKGDHQGCVPIMAPNGAGSGENTPHVSGPHCWRSAPKSPWWPRDKEADVLEKTPILGQTLSALSPLTGGSWHLRATVSE